MREEKSKQELRELTAWLLTDAKNGQPARAYFDERTRNAEDGAVSGSRDRQGGMPTLSLPQTGMDSILQELAGTPIERIHCRGGSRWAIRTRRTAIEAMLQCHVPADLLEGARVTRVQRSGSRSWRLILEDDTTVDLLEVYRAVLCTPARFSG